MSFTVSYDPKKYSFEVESNGSTIGSYPTAYLKTVPGINPDDIGTTEDTLKNLFDNVECPEGWEKQAVSNTLAERSIRVAQTNTRGGVSRSSALPDCSCGC